MDKFEIINKNSRLFLLNILFVLFLQLNLISCVFVDEDRQGLLTIAEGHVLDFYTKKGVAGTKIIFKNEEIGKFPWEDIQTSFDTIITDSLGFYHLEFISDTLRDYSIEIRSTDKYYCVKGDGSGSGFGRRLIGDGIVNKNDFYLKPFCTLNLHVVNKDHIYNELSVKNYQTLYWKIQYEILSGYNVDTILKLKIVPDFENELIFSFYKNTQYSGQRNLIFYLTGIKDTTIEYDY